MAVHRFPGQWSFLCLEITLSKDKILETHASLFEVARVPSLSERVLMEKNYCETWNKWFRVFSLKGFLFPAFSLEKLKEQIAEKSRSTHQRSSVKKVVLTNFTVFLGKHLCYSLFLIKLRVSPRLQHSHFPVNIAKFLRTPILKSISERLHLEHAGLYKQQHRSL